MPRSTAVAVRPGRHDLATSHARSSMTYRTLLLVPFLSLSIVTAQGEVEPRCQVTKGASLWLVHESSVTATIRVRGNEIRTKEHLIHTLHLQVTDLDSAGHLLVTTKVVRVRGTLELAAGQGQAEFDTADASRSGDRAAQEVAAPLAAAAGKSFCCKVSPRGQVLELGEGAAELIEQGHRGGSMHERSEAQLRQWVEAAFGTPPEKRSPAGAQWQHTVSDTVGKLPTRQQWSMSLADVAPETFAVGWQGTVALDTERAAANRQKDAVVIGQIEKAKVTTGKAVGKQTISRTDGFVLHGQHEVELVFETPDPRLGSLVTNITATTTIGRTSEAEALVTHATKEAPAKDGAKGADKQMPRSHR